MQLSSMRCVGWGGAETLLEPMNTLIQDKEGHAGLVDDMVDLCLSAVILVLYLTLATG